MLNAISLEDLSVVTGGRASSPSAQAWAQIRSEAAPHCPATVAKYTKAPATRSQAQAIGNQCLAEMGPFKAAMGGTSQINAGIDAAFPR